MRALLYVSGQVGVDSRGKLQPAFEKQAAQVWKNIGQVLKAPAWATSDIVEGHDLPDRQPLHRAQPRGARPVHHRGALSRLDPADRGRAWPIRHAGRGRGGGGEMRSGRGRKPDGQSVARSWLFAIRRCRQYAAYADAVPVPAPARRAIAASKHCTPRRCARSMPVKRKGQGRLGLQERPRPTVFDKHGPAASAPSQAGPTWKAIDGTSVVGEVVDQGRRARRGAIPWLLRGEEPRSGTGALTEAAFIRRGNTEAAAPAGLRCQPTPKRPCDAQPLSVLRRPK